MHMLSTEMPGLPPSDTNGFVKLQSRHIKVICHLWSLHSPWMDSWHGKTMHTIVQCFTEISYYFWVVPLARENCCSGNFYSVYMVSNLQYKTGPHNAELASLFGKDNDSWVLLTVSVNRHLNLTQQYNIMIIQHSSNIYRKKICLFKALSASSRNKVSEDFIVLKIPLKAKSSYLLWWEVLFTCPCHIPNQFSHSLQNQGDVRENPKPAFSKDPYSLCKINLRNVRCSSNKAISFSTPLTFQS